MKANEFKEGEVVRLNGKLTPLTADVKVSDVKSIAKADAPIEETEQAKEAEQATARVRYKNPLLQIIKQLRVGKPQTNKFGNYKYRSLEDIFQALKPLLSEYGCVLQIQDSVEMVGERYYVKATCTLILPTGEAITTTGYARECEEKKGMDVSQLTGSCSSYARKYALGAMFLLDDGKDADAQDNSYSASSKDYSYSASAAFKDLDKPVPRVRDIPTNMTRDQVSRLNSEMQKCNDLQELTDFWYAHSELHKDEMFKEMVRGKKQSLKN